MRVEVHPNILVQASKYALSSGNKDYFAVAYSRLHGCILWKVYHMKFILFLMLPIPDIDTSTKSS